jgi:hypothetical protein
MQDLPDETILDIFWVLDGPDRDTTLHCLRVVSRRIGRLANEVIYRSANVPATIGALVKFTRTVMNNPTWTARARTLTLTINTWRPTGNRARSFDKGDQRLLTNAMDEQQAGFPHWRQTAMLEAPTAVAPVLLSFFPALEELTVSEVAEGGHGRSHHHAHATTSRRMLVYRHMGLFDGTKLCPRIKLLRAPSVVPSLAAYIHGLRHLEFSMVVASDNYTRNWVALVAADKVAQLRSVNVRIPFSLITVPFTSTTPNATFTGELQAFISDPRTRYLASMLLPLRSVQNLNVQLVDSERLTATSSLSCDRLFHIIGVGARNTKIFIPETHANPIMPLTSLLWKHRIKSLTLPESAVVTITEDTNHQQNLRTTNVARVLRLMRLDIANATGASERLIEKIFKQALDHGNPTLEKVTLRYNKDFKRDNSVWQRLGEQYQERQALPSVVVKSREA